MAMLNNSLIFEDRVVVAIFVDWWLVDYLDNYSNF